MNKKLLLLILVFSFVSNIYSTYSESLQYHNYETMSASLKDIAGKYPKLVKLQTHGKTLGNRDIWSVTISANSPEKNPAILIVGGVEGVDLVGSEMCLQFIQTLVMNYGKVDSITNLLNKTTFYIFPRVNPDASETFFDKIKYERHLNSRPMDLDKDGLIDEDGYDDLNNDGFITMMRITDPAGEWLPDSEIPELLKKADYSKGEKGLYKLLSEGKDNDGDGNWNEDEQGGVNFNQNFSYKYKFFEKGAGLYQISEVETRAIADFAFSHLNIAIVFCFSSVNNLMYQWKVQEGKQDKKENPWERKPITAVQQKDAPYFKQISEKFKSITKLTDAPEPEDSNGTFAEWAYYHFGRWSFSVPAWWVPVITDKPDSNETKEDKSPKPKKKADDKDPLLKEKRLWKWIQSTNQKDAFVQWKEISHPDFPDRKVEIGGFKPFIDINPPTDRLQYLADKYNPFLIYLASTLPRVKIKETKVEHLHDNVYRVKIYVSNEGYLPTNTEIGTISMWNPKVKVAVKLEQKQKIVSGKTSYLIDSISGSDSAKELSLLIVGDKGSKITISVGSPTAGEDEKVVILK